MFTNQPPKAKEYLPHIVRIKSGQTLNARIAGDPLRISTHYTGGRTHPCLEATGLECPLCLHIGNPRYYAYWPISGSTGLQAAVELTELAELQLLQVLPENVSAVGSLVTFHRPNGRRNNPVQVSLPAVLPSDEKDRQKKIVPIPQTQVAKSLFRIWDCPPSLDRESFADYTQRLGRILLARYASLVADLISSR